MFGEKEKRVRISKNAVLKIPDEKVCKTCTQFEPNHISYYEADVKVYEITCGFENICGYVYDEMVKELSKKVEEDINGKLKEEKEGQ